MLSKERARRSEEERGGTHLLLHFCPLSLSLGSLSLDSSLERESTSRAWFHAQRLSCSLALSEERTHSHSTYLKRELILILHHLSRENSFYILPRENSFSFQLILILHHPSQERTHSLLHHLSQVPSPAPFLCTQFLARAHAIYTLAFSFSLLRGRILVSLSHSLSRTHTLVSLLSLPRVAHARSIYSILRVREERDFEDRCMYTIPTIIRMKMPATASAVCTVWSSSNVILTPLVWFLVAIGTPRR